MMRHFLYFHSAQGHTAMPLRATHTKNFGLQNIIAWETIQSLLTMQHFQSRPARTTSLGRDILVISQYSQVEVEDVEGRIRDFFRGIFGRSTKPEEEYEQLEEDEEDEEDEFLEDEGVGGNPFVRDGKLYGQDYDKLKVTVSIYSKLCVFSLFHIRLLLVEF